MVKVKSAAVTSAVVMFSGAMVAALFLTLRAAQDTREAAAELKEAASAISEAASGIKEPEQSFDSPRLATLAKELRGGNPSALQEFWQEMAGKAPLVEPVSGDARSSWVTYMWRGVAGTRRVFVMGGPWPDDSSIKWLARLDGSDLWYRTERLPSDSRFIYSFHVNGPVRWPMDNPAWLAVLKGNPFRTDPLNPREGEPWQRGSIAELPDAPPQPWTQKQPGVPEGALIERKLSSELLPGPQSGAKQERTVMVYAPPGYDPQGPAYPLLLMFDGGGYNDRHMPIPVILDNLIAQRTIAPLVAVFVFQGEDRNLELSCSPPFADFMAKEVVPWARSNYRVSAAPDRTIIGGWSAGGLMAAYCGSRYPEVFGNVLSLSGSFPWYPGYWESPTAALDAEPAWLIRQFLMEPRRAVRFYLAAGRFENSPGFSLLGENRHLRDVLQAKGYSVQSREFNGGHDALGWRGPFVEGLIALTGAPK
jgi:enterochelin esterase family protein